MQYQKSDAIFCAKLPRTKQVACGIVTRLIKLHRAAAKAAQGSEGCSAQPRQLSVGIITPYALQVDEIAGLLELPPAGGGSGGPDKVRAYLRNLSGVTVEARSVDGFQGREMDVIILSTVRSNHHGNIGFVADDRWVGVEMEEACVPKSFAHTIKNVACSGEISLWLHSVLGISCACE